MSNKISVHDALKGVDELLEPLTDEERGQIFTWIGIKYKLANLGVQTNSPPGGATKKEQQIEEEIPSNISIKDFIAKKKPDGYYERIACLAYYLEKFEGKDKFKTADITKANDEARLGKFPHSTMYINNAVHAYGFLNASTGGTKVLSARGEAVAEALPSRESVEQALQDHPVKKKAAKKSTKKK